MTIPGWAPVSGVIQVNLREGLSLDGRGCGGVSRKRAARDARGGLAPSKSGSAHGPQTGPGSEGQGKSPLPLGTWQAALRLRPEPQEWQSRAQQGREVGWMQPSLGRRSLRPGAQQEAVWVRLVNLATYSYGRARWRPIDPWAAVPVARPPRPRVMNLADHRPHSLTSDCFSENEK